jgi:PST family polysaccharide transporter
MHSTEKLFNRTLYKRILDYGVVQALGYLIPLLSIPYIVRVLGAESYGGVILAFSMNNLLLLVTDFAVQIWAVREVISNRNNTKYLSSLITTILIIKSVLMLILLIFFYLFFIVINVDPKVVTLFWIGVPAYIFQIITPIWFFQSIENSRAIVFLSITWKLIATLPLFILVKNSSDDFLIPALNSIGSFFMMIISIRILLKNYKYKIILPRPRFIWKKIKYGSPIFASTLISGIYANMSYLIIGFIVKNLELLAIYAAAEKIIWALKSLFIPIAQSTITNIIFTIRKDKKEGQRKIIRGGLIASIPVSIAIIIVGLFSNEIIYLIYGIEFKGSEELLRVMLIIPLLVIFSYGFTNIGLIGLKKNMSFSIVNILGTFIYIISMYIFIENYSILGAAIAMVVTEISIALISGCLFYCAIKLKSN